MGALKQWCLDWLDRANVEPSDRKIDDPIAILQRAFGALAGILAILSSPAISLLAPNINSNARIVLLSLIGLATLVAVNHVVTAKDVGETTSGFSSRIKKTYRFSSGERWAARAILLIALILPLLNLVPAPKDCNLTAIVDWQADGSPTPVSLSSSIGGRSERYPVERGKPVAMKLPAAHLGTFSIVLMWSDNSASDFGTFAGCSTVANRSSTDGRAQVELAVR